MLRSLLLCLLPVVICETELRVNVNDGIEYYGTSNVRYQKTYPTPLYERPQAIPSTTVTVSPPSTSQAPASTEVYKTNQFFITTQSSPSYNPRRKPLYLPRPTRPWSTSNLQATEQPVVVPTSFVSNRIPQIQTESPASQPSIISAPRVVIQVISSPQTPQNTTLNTLAIAVPVSTADGKAPANVSSIDAEITNRQLLTNQISLSKSFEAADVPFGSVPESLNKSEHQPILVLEPKHDSLPVREQVPQLERQSALQFKSNYHSGKAAYPIKMRPKIIFVPVLDDTTAEDTDATIPTLPDISDFNKTPATNEMPVPVVAPMGTSSDAANLPLITNTSQEPIIIANNNRTVVEIPLPPSVVPSSETQSVTGPKVIIQLITDSQLPSNSPSQPPATLPLTTTYQPVVTSAQLNTSTVLPTQSPNLSLLDTEKVSEKTIQPNLELAFYVTKPESKNVPDKPFHLEKELTSLTKSQTTDEPKTNIAFQTQPIKIKPPSTFAPLSKTEPDLEAYIKAFTNAPPPLTHNSDISPYTSDFEHKVNGPLPMIASQSNIPDHAGFSDKFSLSSIVTAEPQQSTEGNIPTQESESVDRSDQPMEFFEENPSDNESELEPTVATSVDTEQVDQPTSEIDLHPEFQDSQSKVEVTSQKYFYPIKIRAQVISGAVPGPVYKPPATKPDQAVLPPLLPRPKPIREPVYGRFTHNTTQYPITSSTNHITKSPSIISPSPAPPLIKPYAIRQPNYVWYSPAPTTTTQYPYIVTTHSTTRAPTVVKTSTLPPQPPGSLKLDFVCKDGNGFYAVENECGSYILCQQNNATKFSCPDGFYFNPAAKNNEYPCTYPWRVQCIDGAGKQYPTRQCPKKYGLFSMNDGDCSRYLMCNVGIATIMNCPAGLVFNPATESCDYVANVPQCNPQVFKDYVCPAPPVDEYGVDTDIIYNYKYGDQCKLYIACQRGYPRLLSCERGLAFDEASQSCVNATNVPNCAPYAT